MKTSGVHKLICGSCIKSYFSKTLRNYLGSINWIWKKYSRIYAYHSIQENLMFDNGFKITQLHKDYKMLINCYNPEK